MLKIFLFTLILLKLDMLNGLPLAIIIIMIIYNIIHFIVKTINLLIQKY